METFKQLDTTRGYDGKDLKIKNMFKYIQEEHLNEPTNKFWNKKKS